jgi:hypothetical protein
VKASAARMPTPLPHDDAKRLLDSRQGISRGLIAEGSPIPPQAAILAPSRRPRPAGWRVKLSHDRPSMKLDSPRGNGGTLSPVRWLGLALLLYVSVDFANPLLPGAVQLDPGASIEAVRSHPGPLSSPSLVHWRQPDPASLPDRLRLVRPEPRLLTPPGWRRVLPLRPPRQPADDLTTALPTEDH